MEIKEGTVLGQWGDRCVLRVVRKPEASRPWWVIAEYHSETGRVDIWKEGDGLTPQEAAINAVPSFYNSRIPVDPTPEGQWAIDEALRIMEERERRRREEEEEARRRWEAEQRRKAELARALDERAKSLAWSKGPDGAYHYRGLAVKKTERGWMVVHVSSGLFVKDRLRRKRDAQRLVAYLVGLPVDWEADADTVNVHMSRHAKQNRRVWEEMREAAELP